MRFSFRVFISAITAIFIALAIYNYWPFIVPSPPLVAYKVDINQTSVSGVSSGGAMAVQMHVAHSSIMRGVGVTAGVAYDCSDSELPSEALRLAQGLICIAGKVSAGFSIGQTTDAWNDPGAIDNPDNLPRQKVWLFSGYNDGTVRRATMAALNAYFTNYVNPGNLFYKINNKAPHALITNDYGGACLSQSVNYINNCDYDSAGFLLKHIYGHLTPPGTNGLSSLPVPFDQSEFVDGNPKAIGLANTGYVYVPLACQTEICRAHVVFHGCRQNADSVGDAVYKHGGYNKWADVNNIIVLYPQTVATDKTLLNWGGPRNPAGCWDWWGYSKPEAHRDDYARKSGYQISAIKAMLGRLTENFQPGEGTKDTFGTPQDFEASDKTSTSVELVWKPNNSAAGFNVYRSDATGGAPTQINSNLIKGASFVQGGLNPATTYHYVINAVEQGSNAESPPTSPISVTTAPAPPPCSPYFSNNVVHHWNLRAYSPWGYETYAVGTADSMGPYNIYTYSHLIKEGTFRYRVGYCP